MSERTSPKTSLKYGIQLLCRAGGLSRSSYYAWIKQKEKSRRGRQPAISDDELLKKIEKCIADSPFIGEGHRKVHALLRRKHSICVGRNRVLRLMKEHRLLSPHRSAKGKARTHDGRITTDEPNEMWATDAAKIFTLEDGWVWFFGVIEHWNSQCLGWHLSKNGDRFAAIEALTQAVKNTFGTIEAEIARGLSLRIDHGAQFLSQRFVNQARYWGISLSKGYVKEPETNGVVERFHRTFKEQIVHGRHYHSIEDLRRAASDFILKYNEMWLLEKLDYHSPIEARNLYEQGVNVVTDKISPRLPGGEEGHGYFVLTSGNEVKMKSEDNFTVSLPEEEEHGYFVLTRGMVAKIGGKMEDKKMQKQI